MTSADGSFSSEATAGEDNLQAIYRGSPSSGLLRRDMPGACGQRVGNGRDQSRWILRGPATGELQCRAPSRREAPASMLGELRVQGYEAAQLLQAKSAGADIQ